LDMWTLGCTIKRAETVLYTLNAECCQCGVFCESSCGRCARALIKVHRGEDDNDDFVTEIMKERRCSSYLFHCDLFNIKFPAKFPVDDKLLLISAVMLIQYQYFADNHRLHRCLC